MPETITNPPEAAVKEKVVYRVVKVDGTRRTKILESGNLEEMSQQMIHLYLQRNKDDDFHYELIEIRTYTVRELLMQL